MQNSPFPVNNNQPTQYQPEAANNAAPPAAFTNVGTQNYTNTSNQYGYYNSSVNPRENQLYGVTRPGYYGYMPTVPNGYPFYGSPDDVKRFYEKKAVKRTAGHIGLGLIINYIVIYVYVFLFSFLSFNESITNIINDPAFSLFLNIILTLIGFMGAAIFIFRMEKTKPDKLLSFGRPKKGTLFPAIMVGIGFCYTANVVVSMLASRFGGLFSYSQSDMELPSGISGMIISVLSVAVFPALLEEFLFRGAIMGNLLKFGKPFAIFTSAVIFALIHGNTVQIPFAFCVGLVSGFLVIETNSIWTGVIVHFLNNFISVFMDYFGEYANEDIVNIVFMFLLAIFIMAGFFGIYLLSIKNKNIFKYNKTKHISSVSQRVGWFCSNPAIIVVFVIIGLEVISSLLLSFIS